MVVVVAVVKTEVEVVAVVVVSYCGSSDCSFSRFRNRCVGMCSVISSGSNISGCSKTVVIKVEIEKVKRVAVSVFS